MRRSLIAGNWKMHGTQASARSLLSLIADQAAATADIEWAVFPPFVHLLNCTELLSQSVVRFGAQTVSEYTDGAYTGEVSAMMLKDLGCHYVIVGHSERRQQFHESNAQLIKKCERVIDAGMQPILCVGETLAEREKGDALSVVKEQLEVVFVLKDNCPAFSGLVIAYEPVWAIGTGKTASPEEAQDVHAAIRARLFEADAALANTTRILYGGSVKPENAKALFKMNDIDGALIGGASLNAASFLEIGKLCNS
ncbi:MAG: triose-phosphate isomerase [Gammaproteobacteria bacterium CG_4_10_14_0_8_um_filter_38_16]|nr:MAG: triose-phosphate isomerase [Gammaproteobacteria bacterium CG_4_10_14_0_8_um_filter_38_16]PJA02883.1 MAG: triose-phosphate isomerase [Gammaproteobacteria bacterium CG_4_10_14_0_2_um_filter_38_22]PJB10953.1 MAG: triose-phosphate isomerase [Gammaproteobacteria bacterium CG_4_9_14_3_um_filter_38_9]